MLEYTAPNISYCVTAINDLKNEGMMAAAEARTACQRTANRCFVQEDAKRAPKLACCPLTSSTPQYDSSNGNAESGPDTPAPNFMPLNWNPVNLLSDTKWWLQLQPSFAYQKDFTCEQLDTLEDELEDETVKTTVPSSDLTGESLHGRPMDVDRKMNACPSLESPSMVSTAFSKHDSESRVEEMKTINNNSQQPVKSKVDMNEYFYHNEELMDWKPIDQLILKKPEKACSDLEMPWAGGNKCEPWWRIADKDELASLVAQKSLQHIENCDLPRPQSVHISRDPFACYGSFDSNGILSSSSGSMVGKHWSFNEVGRLLYDSDKLHSAHAFNTTIKDPPESWHASESNSSRAQLLEALRHSQTRAREAEMAAQKAYNEKEHIVKLLFGQASHLFAYKQWLKMLQLESLSLQLKIKDHQISTLFPVLPWMPLKRKQSSREKINAMRRKGRKLKKCNICNYAIALAIGLGLVGAGLLLGWNLAWLLPTS